MSYPNDSPALDMSDYDVSGFYTPTIVSSNLIDYVTPVNKNSFRNSYGVEISRIQNYINSHYIGREDLPVETGYINTLVPARFPYLTSPSGNLHVSGDIYKSPTKDYFSDYSGSLSTTEGSSTNGYIKDITLDETSCYFVKAIGKTIHAWGEIVGTLDSDDCDLRLPTPFAPIDYYSITDYRQYDVYSLYFSGTAYPTGYYTTGLIEVNGHDGNQIIFHRNHYYQGIDNLSGHHFSFNFNIIYESE